jgi:dTDP-3-amino-3,4,6-trideoxy-alpha-D-glucose transaminase
MGVGVGDEVIVPSYTAVPTASAVCAVGAVPVPVDVELATAAVDPQAVLEAVTERTSAVVPVHLYGRPVDMSELATCGVPILEDGAQAHGATHGVVGQALALSFYPTKNLGGIGDGGAVVTDDAELADDVRRRRQHGMAEQYVHVEVSQNFRMSEIEAAWLRLTLPGLGAGNERRRSIARAYRAAAPWLDWQADHPDHVYHLCVARVPDRDDFRRRLASAGVGTAVQYPLSIGEQPAYRRFARTATPNAERWAAQCVSVPCFPELTDAEVEYVAAVLGASAP